MVNHLQSYSPREIYLLPTVANRGWQLKRYGILAKDREFDPATASCALGAAIDRLPTAGKLSDPKGNHGVGFQLIHFAEVAVVSPVFYWLWGSVLANADQMRAPWENTKAFETGAKEVVGCIWELQVVCFEIQTWKDIMLGGSGESEENLGRYLNTTLPAAKTNF